MLSMKQENTVSAYLNHKFSVVSALTSEMKAIRLKAQICYAQLKHMKDPRRSSSIRSGPSNPK